MTTFEFNAHGLPKGQPRVKATAFGGKHARVYDPGTANDWKQSVKVAAHGAGATNAMLDGPLSVTMTIWFPRPKSHYRSGKNADQLRPDVPWYHTAKPDADNAAKAILDALTDACVWRDDAQVCVLLVHKTYSPHPGANIRIETLKPAAIAHREVSAKL